ncbi:hypothetical protein MKW94_027298 [Papaver nudicaule]|uniref:Histidine-containing phosphotransfer protein n=1 Tax=Papaver nudicaule TaxID=74823 RepID=A0AA41V569_PAPNU|nr:hypothetical protein [Papaver nudicaule]MCL7048134.1 hypothetical protein [Papaver nudicaule]
MSLRGTDEPDFMVTILTVFCKDTEERIKKIETQHMKPRLHIRTIAALIETIKGSSLSVGSEKVTQACNEFQKAKEQWKLAKCEKALLQLRCEFNHVKSVFVEIIKLERKIVFLTRPQLRDVTESTGSSSP